jgi:hypothetical protein
MMKKLRNEVGEFCSVGQWLEEKKGNNFYFPSIEKNQCYANQRLTKMEKNLASFLDMLETASIIGERLGTLRIRTSDSVYFGIYHNEIVFPGSYTDTVARLYALIEKQREIVAFLNSIEIPVE